MCTRMDWNTSHSDASLLFPADKRVMIVFNTSFKTTSALDLAAHHILMNIISIPEQRFVFSYYATGQKRVFIDSYFQMIGSSDSNFNRSRENAPCAVIFWFSF